jgi:hypothetical protein
MDTTYMLLGNLIEEFGNSQLCWKERLIEYVVLFNQLEHNFTATMHC